MSKIIWLSVDPTNGNINYYPLNIANKIEKNYKRNELLCELGKDFYNATIHFKINPANLNLFSYQTTQGVSLGRAGYKYPGYRSVKRITILDDNTITIYTKKIEREWRIVNEYEPNVIIKNEIVPDNVKINMGEDREDREDSSIVVWQWCKGVPEKNSDIIRLSDEWWIPYLHEQNIIIEDAFSKNKENVVITLQDETTRKIKFINNNIFGHQLDESNNKERIIRRIIMYKKELQNLLDIQKQIIDISVLGTLLKDDEIPHNFICSITQDIMTEPVKTVDGFTYDKFAIEKWFKNSNKSPLTGLDLTDTTLTPNNELLKIMEEFTKLKINKEN